jgi:hypothetical protein
MTAFHRPRALAVFRLIAGPKISGPPAGIAGLSLEDATDGLAKTIMTCAGSPRMDSRVEAGDEAVLLV